VIRGRPEDFQVREELGFDLSGDGEHVFLYLQKRGLNTMDLLDRVAQLGGVSGREVGVSGLKDRNALTSQWLSVGLAGRPEPDWCELEADGHVRVLEVGRHRRKLKRGVHRANRFTLTLRDLRGEPERLQERLERVSTRGVPNYFGEQRFGRGGSTLDQARRWLERGGPRLARNRRSLYLSALRSELFNRLLAARVSEETWDRAQDGDMCVLAGTRSHFRCDRVDDDIEARIRTADLHPALPLWGRGEAPVPEGQEMVCRFLEGAGLELAWRAARIVPDDFCWRFCDDGSLQLDFALGAGSYATALLAELVHYQEKRNSGSDKGSE
jgi:tRNA pseudouridine13 synthase